MKLTKPFFVCFFESKKFSLFMFCTSEANLVILFLFVSKQYSLFMLLEG